jgi:SP family sugar:H+ symporter-like MFS transporter
MLLITLASTLNAVSLIYAVEVTSPQKRGALTALFNVGTAAGNLIVSGVCAGTAHISTNWAWQTPVLIQIPLALVYGIGIMMFPESPRWLLLNGKEARA